MKKSSILFLCLLLGLGGCKHRLKAPDGYDIYTVQAKPITNELFFTGTVQPLKAVMVTSPAEGMIEKKYFEYGQQVKAGEVLFSLRSSQLEKDYRDALAAYLKTKEQYENNHIKLQEDEVLHQAGIISTNEYHASQINFNDTYLGFFQSEQALKQILEKANAKIEDAKKIMISDRAAVNKALLTKFDVLALVAPVDGVALLPEKGAGTSGESDSSAGSTKFIVGSQVKTGQVVASIGDMTGVSFVVSVNQVDINAIKIGQKATVTSDGFPGVVLQGDVAEVSAQAVSTGVGGGLPTFPVRVDIKNLPERDRKKIAVGMTAMVKITVLHEPMMLVPIKAIIARADVSKIKMFDRKTNKIIEVPVSTGQTTLQEVVVTQGLLPGDHILVHR